MRRRPVRTFVAWTSALFVFLLFAFPNYCDRCQYRDVARLLAERQRQAEVAEAHPCCAGKAKQTAPAGHEGKSGAPPTASHARVPYCIGKTLASVAEFRDVLGELLRILVPSTFRPEARAFARLFPVLDHKDSRAPPA